MPLAVIQLLAPIQCHGPRLPRLRSRARLTPSKAICVHHAPVAFLCLRAPPSSLTWRFPFRCFSSLFPLFLLSIFSPAFRPSVLPDPCSIRSPLSSSASLVVVPESRPDSSQPLPQNSPMGWGCGWALEERDSWLYQAKSAAVIRCIGRTDRGTDRAGSGGMVSRAY
jgi:hypothetical protein